MRERGMVLARVWNLRPPAERRPLLAPPDGVPDEPEHPDRRRCLDAQRIHLTRCRPIARADVVLDDTDPAAPRIRRITPRRAALAQNDPS